MKDGGIKVLYIVGFGRSGTTLLDSILGQIEGFFSLGELIYIWDRCIRDDRLCGCGQPFSSCPEWIPVMERMGDTDPSMVDSLIAFRDRLGPMKALKSSRGGRRPLGDDGLRALLHQHGRLYRAVQELKGSRVLVDSSKFPALGYLLKDLPDVEPYFVHLVRDPRAVAQAWLKKKVYDPSGDQPMYMSRFSVPSSSQMWTKWNLASEVLCGRPRSRYLRLRYEDFVRRPRDMTMSLLEWMDEPDTELPFSGEHEVQLGQNHSVGGNPSRFKVGPVSIRSDDAWRKTISLGQRLTVLALTWPLFLRYGYGRRPSP